MSFLFIICAIYIQGFYELSGVVGDERRGNLRQVTCGRKHCLHIELGAATAARMVRNPLTLGSAISAFFF